MSKKNLQIVTRAVKREGLVKVANKLGYRSPTTIHNWLRDEQISPAGNDRIKERMKSLGAR